MEIAKFVLTAVGTFVTVMTLSRAVFQSWEKRQEKKFSDFKETLLNEIQSNGERIKAEKSERVDGISRLGARIEKMEALIMNDIQRRMSSIEGELKGMRNILEQIQNWFIQNTPKG
jgi:hypothetical protein